jgi:hypothetical protein
MEIVTVGRSAAGLPCNPAQIALRLVPVGAAEGEE